MKITTGRDNNMKMPFKDLKLCRKAIQIHGHDRVQVAIAETLSLNPTILWNVHPTRFNDMLRFLYVANGKLYTKAMFKMALLANTDLPSR
jgi:hypothetical protein